MTENSLKRFAYLSIEKYKTWMKTQVNQDLPIPPRSIHIVKGHPDNEYVNIFWGIGQSRTVPRSLIYYANSHAQAIADNLVGRAGKSETFTQIVEFFVTDPLHITYTGSLYYRRNRDPLSWQGCPPYVLGAIRAIGYSLNVPHDVLLSDELLPAIARILRGNDEQD